MTNGSRAGATAGSAFRRSNRTRSAERLLRRLLIVVSYQCARSAARYPLSRKRGKKPKAAVEAVPEDVLAEGSGPVGGGTGAGAGLDAGAIATVEDVVTTADIATTEDVVTADDVVATAVEPAAASDGSRGPGNIRVADDAALQPQDGVAEAAEAELDAAFTSMDMAVASGIALGGAGGAGASDDGADGGDDGADGGDDGDGSGGRDGDGDGDDDAAIVFPTSAAGMDAAQLKHLVEALIFASDRPLTVQRLRQLTRVGEVRRLEQALAELADDYRERGLILQQVSGGYQFRTRTQFSPWVQQLIAGRPVRLSRAQLETLAIIAYRQPITRPEIDDIRGVDSSATLKLLIDRMLIRVLGKREEVGRPILYGTTKEFLDFFSLGDLRELPTLREYSELTAESRKVMSDRLGIGPDGGNGSDAGPHGNGAGHPGSQDGADAGDGSHGRNGPSGPNGHGSNGTGSHAAARGVASFDDGGLDDGGMALHADGAVAGEGSDALDDGRVAVDDGGAALDDSMAEIASARDLADAAAPFLAGDEGTEPPGEVDAGELGDDAAEVKSAPASDPGPGAD
jgi:segregation and condensation protein B